MGAYCESLGDGAYRPTDHAGGAWNDDEIHFSPLGGLLVHAIDQHRAAQSRDGKNLGRVNFDILGFLPLDDCTIQVETIRPGRTIELIEAVAVIRGRRATSARAWFVSDIDTSAVAGGEPDRIAAPDEAASWPMTATWGGGYVGSLEVRAVGSPLPGRAGVWLNSTTELVEGEQCSATASFIALVDTANGVAVRQKPAEWVFPNLDLTIHLYRQPVGGWVGLDTTVVIGPTGLGLTSSVLHDVAGPVGRAEQILTVRPVK